MTILTADDLVIHSVALGLSRAQQTNQPFPTTEATAPVEASLHGSPLRCIGGGNAIV